MSFLLDHDAREEIETKTMDKSKKSELLGKINLLFARAPSPHNPENREEFNYFRARSLTFLSQVFGSSHHYFKQFDREVVDPWKQGVEAGLGILGAARDDIEQGWLDRFQALLSAEIFSDFLEKAEYLLSEHYKDAAAVMIGSVLEEHLRQLCCTHNIPVEAAGRHIKTSVLNDHLGKVAYGKLDQKQVSAWLDLRNNAVHGKYGEYNEEQVKTMLSGVREFMTRVRP